MKVSTEVGGPTVPAAWADGRRDRDRVGGAVDDPHLVAAPVMAQPARQPDAPEHLLQHPGARRPSPPRSEQEAGGGQAEAGAEGTEAGRPRRTTASSRGPGGAVLGVIPAPVGSRRLPDRRTGRRVGLGGGHHLAGHVADHPRLLGGDRGHAVTEHPQVLGEDGGDHHHRGRDQRDLVRGAAHARLQDHRVAPAVGEVAQRAEGEEPARGEVAVVGERSGHAPESSRPPPPPGPRSRGGRWPRRRP